MRVFRSLLYAAGDRLDLIEAAAASNADALLFDLEGRVAEERKSIAREIVREAVSKLGGEGRIVYVRVNGADSGLLRRDLEAVVSPSLEGVRVPKVDSVEAVRMVDQILGEVEKNAGLEWGAIQMCIGIESARGVQYAGEIFSASPRITSVALGLGRGGDLERDVKYVPTDEGLETLYIRSQVLVAARAVGVRLPIDGGYGGSGVGTEPEDSEGLIRSATQALHLGYRAKICFYPHQVEHVNRIFMPTSHDLETSSSLLESAVGGAVNPTDLENARRVLSWAEN